MQKFLNGRCLRPIRSFGGCFLFSVQINSCGVLGLAPKFSITRTVMTGFDAPQGLGIFWAPVTAEKHPATKTCREKVLQWAWSFVFLRNNQRIKSGRSELYRAFWSAYCTLNPKP